MFHSSCSNIKSYPKAAHLKTKGTIGSAYWRKQISHLLVRFGKTNFAKSKK